LTIDYRYRTILGVALPLMVSSFIQAIILITDSYLISRHSTIEFDAVGNGGLIYVTMFMALAGMGDGAQILIARRIGQNRFDSIGRIFGTSILTHLVIASILFIIMQFIMPGMLDWYSKHKDLSVLQGKFIRIRSFALFFAMITLSIQALFIAKGRTWIVLASAIISAVSNYLFGKGLIFGNSIFPEMGLEGAALASTIADGISMLFLIVMLLVSKEKADYKLLSHFSIDKDSFKELLNIGSPLMFQGFIALATWTIFFTWIEQMGKFELTVSQNIRSIYFLVFVPIWGFGGTTKTYISQYLGRGDLHALKTIQRRIQLLTVVFLFIFFHGAILYPEKLIAFINPETTYFEKSSEILRYIAGSIFMYGFVSVYFQTINGSGNTRASFLIEVINVLVYTLFSYLFIKIFKFDIFWVWTVEYIYFGTMGILSIVYLRTFDWQNKKV